MGFLAKYMGTHSNGGTTYKKFTLLSSDVTADATIADFVVETGTDYIRYDSGIQICWLNTTTNMALDTAYASLYIGNYSWTYPKAFTSVPTVTVGMMKWGTGASWGTLAGLPSTTSATLRGIDAVSRASGNTYIQAMAIGRWK